MIKIMVENDNSTFDADREFIIKSLSYITLLSSNVPFDEFGSIRWRAIVKDVRRILFGVNESPYVRTKSIEVNLTEEGYDNPEKELYDVLIDGLDDIEEHGHDSVYSRYANSLSLLMRGELFQW